MILMQIGNNLIRAREFWSNDDYKKPKPTFIDRIKRVDEHRKRIEEEMRKAK